MQSGSWADFCHFNVKIIQHFKVFLPTSGIKRLVIFNIISFKNGFMHQIKEILVGVKHIDAILMLPKLEREVNVKYLKISLAIKSIDQGCQSY